MFFPFSWFALHAFSWQHGLTVWILPELTQPYNHMLGLTFQYKSLHQTLTKFWAKVKTLIGDKEVICSLVNNDFCKNHKLYFKDIGLHREPLSSDVRLWMKKCWSEFTSHNVFSWPASNRSLSSILPKCFRFFQPSPVTFSFALSLFLQFVLWVDRILTTILVEILGWQ